MAVAQILSSGVNLPTTLNAAMVWSAFDGVCMSTDWRLRVASLEPLKLSVEYDEDFQAALSGSNSWLTRDKANAWIATRTLQLAAAIDKTCVRRLSLQSPRSASDADTALLLANLRRRIIDASTMLDLARQARELGFTSIGITGGEPFMIASMPALGESIADVLPVIGLAMR